MSKKKSISYFSREKWVYFALILVVVLIIGRLFLLQVVQASDLKAKGIVRRTQDQSLTPARGNIFDSQGYVLAQSVPVKQVYADPRTLSQLIATGQFKKTKEDVAQQLASILGLEKKEVFEKLSKDLAWISISQQVDIKKAEEVMALKIPGIGLKDQQKRVYPMERIAASTLGIVNLDGHGVEGIEAFYEDYLYGKLGFSSTQKDSRQRSIFSPSQLDEGPRSGANLTLTLDSTIQYLIEQQLDILQSTTKAKKLSILAMDPMTGKILGIGSRPTFDPNQYNDTPNEDRRNLSVSMSYEPGSTFKIITGAAALEEGIISPSDKFNDPGFLKVGNRVIYNWDSDQRPHGNITFTEGMQLSSNVVLAQVGMKLGKSTFYNYLKAFGFGTKTNVDIAGEENGLLVPQDKSREIDLTTMSFGQANLVTPIQLLTAVSAIANGGTLYKPFIVEKVTAQDGTLIKENKPTSVRKVVSKTTALQMSKIMEEVVTEGTGKTTQIPGIRVAGKTGTAQKVDTKTGQYSKTDFIASFVAFAPADNPKIAVLVTIDSPQGEVHQGGALGGPRAKAVIEGALQYYGIPVAKDTPSQITVTPNDPPVRPAPTPVNPERSPQNGEVTVPDLTGLTIRQAGEQLSKLELKFNFIGSGLVNKQSPTPGKVVTKGTFIELRCSSLEPKLGTNEEVVK